MNSLDKSLLDNTQSLPKPRVITEVVKGSFPGRLGKWRIEKYFSSSLWDARISGFLTVYLPAYDGGSILVELQSVKHEVLFAPLKNQWGKFITINGAKFRYESSTIPFCGSCVHPVTWTELFEYGMIEVQKISDILVEVVGINEAKLQETL